MSNTGETQSGIDSTVYQAQSFTTGNNQGGYTLSSVELSLDVDTTSVTSVVIRGDHNSKFPRTGAPVVTLVNPSTLADGLNSFTAPTGTTVTLARNTRYWVSVNEGVSLSDDAAEFGYTASDSETSLFGWTVANSRVGRHNETEDWSKADTSMSIAIKGSRVNLAPTVANMIRDQAAVPGAEFSYTFPSSTFNDGNGDTLTYSAVEDGETRLPSWLSFDPDSRTFSGTPANAGALTVKVTADDGNGGSVSDSFDITVSSTCGAPSYAAGERELWKGTVTVGSDAFRTKYGVDYSFGIGALDNPEVQLGGRRASLVEISTEYVAADRHIVTRFQLRDANFTTAERQHVKLYICGTSFALGGTQDYTEYQARWFTYKWTTGTLNLSQYVTADVSLTRSVPDSPATGSPAIGVVCTREFPCPAGSRAAYTVEDFGALHEGLVLAAHVFPDAGVRDGREHGPLALMTDPDGYGDRPSVSYQWVRMKHPVVAEGDRPEGAQGRVSWRHGLGGDRSFAAHLRVPQHYHWTHPMAAFDPDAHWAGRGAPETFGDDVLIPGATGRTYRIQAADAGHWIKLRVTTTDRWGGTTTAESTVQPAATWPGIYMTGGQGPKPNVCDRTPAVRDAIMRTLRAKPPFTSKLKHCRQVTAGYLAGITVLNYGSSGLETDSLKRGDFDGLTGLVKLFITLKDATLTRLPDGLFAGLRSLEELIIQGDNKPGGLTVLQDGLLLGLEGLRIFDALGHEDLAAVGGNLFGATRSLEKVYLRFLPALEQLPAGLLHGQRNLKLAEITDNGSLTEIPAGFFRDNPNLLIVVLYVNPALDTLPAGLFDASPQITSINAESSGLSSLPDGLFERLTSLETLDLSGNDGEPFKPVAIAGLEQSVSAGATVTLSGTAAGPWGGNVTWAWTHVDGENSNTAVTGSGEVDLTPDPDNPANRTFTAPDSGTLYFRLAATPVPRANPDDDGTDKSDADWVKVTVTSSQITAPSVSGAAISDPPGGNGAWDAGETVEAVLTFDEAVTVDTANGAPYVQFELGADATRRNAAYASGSGGTALTFRYTVPAGQGPYTNALLAIDSLALNGGAIRSTATGADAALAHGGAAHAGAVIRSTASGPTARFSALPESHDGTSAFEVELAFSGDPGGISYVTVRDSLIEATGGAIGNARRKTKGSDEAWVLTVRPSGRGSVTLTLPSRACGTKAAICIGGEPLASDATAAVPGPDTPAPALPAISIAAPAQTPVDEGAALSFTLTRTGAADGALTVAVSVAETGDVLDGTPPASVRFAPGSATAALRVPTLDDEDFEEASTVTVTVAGGTGYTVAAGVASASGIVESDDLAPITAQFTQAQDEHDGGAFLLQFTFSHAPLLSYVTVRDALFDVTGGRIERARRLARGSNAGWELRVVPDGFGDVALSARATADCAAAHAVCDAAGRKFDGALERTIQGPPTLSVADAAVDEARGATLDFAVTLSRALDTAVTVAWKTADVTAEAGFDYTAANDTLTFAAGETAQTISVAVLTDAHDEGSETLTVTLSDPAPSRVKLADGAATGTIRNTDAMPQAWIARFGRTVAEQVLDAVEGRLRAARTPGVEVSLAGERIGWRPEAGDGRAGAEDRTARATAAKDAAADEEAGREATRLAEWLRGETDPEEEGRRRGRTVTDRDLLLGLSFNVTAEAGGPGSGGGTVSVWGRGAVTNFDGREGELTVDGEVASAMLGADWDPGSGSGAGRTLAGLIVGHSAGEGGYRSPSGNGTVTSTLTGLYPWGRYALTDRVEVWGAAGYGEGALTLTPEGADAIRTDMDLWMAAAGLRGTIVDGGEDGFTLTAKTDAMAVETSTAAVPGDLAASEAGVTRLRLGLEGSLPVRLGGGSVLTPSMEIGARHDGGDAETGFGADIGGGIAWKDPKRGIAAEIRGRGLLTHEADGFRERGLSGALGWNPVEGGRGPSLSLTQTFGGAASGGADALLRRGTMEGLAANHDGAGDDLEARRLEARFGYGFAAFGYGFTLTPEAGFGLSDTGRDYSLGWRLVRVERGGGIPGASLELSFEATRRESAANDDIPPEHGVGLRLISRF